MEIPCFSQIITDNVTEEVIDAYTLSKQLESLRDLALEYNERPSTNPFNKIQLDKIGDNKFDLIVSLWQRGITIAEHLNITYGAPYDTTFKMYSPLTLDEDETNTICAPIEETITYTVLKHPQQLMGFLVSAVDLDQPDPATAENYSMRVSLLNNDVLAKLKIDPIKNLYEFTKRICKLRQLDLVYIALEAENCGLYRNGISIWTYMDIYLDKE